MTPQTNATPISTPPAAAPWWQTLLISVANIAVGAIVQHYLGNVAGGVAIAGGTAVAHALPSPHQWAK